LPRAPAPPVPKAAPTPHRLVGKAPSKCVRSRQRWPVRLPRLARYAACVDHPRAAALRRAVRDQRQDPAARHLAAVSAASPRREPRATIHAMRYATGTLSGGLALLLLIGGLGVAPVAAQPGGMQEYTVPTGSHPHDVAPAADGGIWYTAQASGQLGWLDPNTG